MYGLLMALAMLFMAGLCACSAQPHSAAETAPQTIVVGIDVFDPYSYLDRNGQFAGIDVELATEAFSRLGYMPEFRTISWPDKDNLLSDGTIDCIWAVAKLSTGPGVRAMFVTLLFANWTRPTFPPTSLMNPAKP